MNITSAQIILKFNLPIHYYWTQRVQSSPLPWKSKYHYPPYGGTSQRHPSAGPSWIHPGVDNARKEVLLAGGSLLGVMTSTATRRGKLNCANEMESLPFLQWWMSFLGKIKKAGERRPFYEKSRRINTSHMGKPAGSGIHIGCSTRWCGSQLSFQTDDVKWKLTEK